MGTRAFGKDERPPNLLQREAHRQQRSIPSAGGRWRAATENDRVREGGRNCFFFLIKEIVFCPSALRRKWTLSLFLSSFVHFHHKNMREKLFSFWTLKLRGVLFFGHFAKPILLSFKKGSPAWLLTLFRAPSYLFNLSKREARENMLYFWKPGLRATLFGPLRTLARRGFLWVTLALRREKGDLSYPEKIPGNKEKIE